MTERKLLETIQNFFRANQNYQPDFIEFSAIMYKLSTIMLESAIEQKTVFKSRTPCRHNKQTKPSAKHNT